MTIYIDVLLALNLFVDFLLLCATARLLSLPVKRWRVILAAVFGALTTLVILLPPLPLWLTAIWQGLTAAGMIAVAFTPKGIPRFLRIVGVFLLAGALFAGICAGIERWIAPRGLLVQSGVVYYDVSPLTLAALTAISYGLLCLFERLTRKRVALGTAYRIVLTDGDEQLTLRAMLDSGHSLTERFSGSPVILANTAAVRPIAAHYDPHAITARTASRIRYIPFSTIGGEGILMAFRPEQAVLHGGGRTQDISGTWVAVTTRIGRGEYEALIGPALADTLLSR